MKKIIIILAIFSLLLLTACASNIADVTNKDYINKKVTIKGTALTPLQIGDLSGYTLTDKNGNTIAVSSTNLPNAGDKVRVRGIIKSGPLGLTYYLED